MAFAGAKDGGDAFFRLAYLLVKDQLICLDDLERSGDGLKQRDVLGLASSLKEQRNCKVVLLLNDEEMDAAEKLEFERQLEKVVDISLVFDPNPQEAADIAFSGGTDLEALLRDRVAQLGIVNIRVIKKIERMAIRLQSMLRDFPTSVQEQAISAVALGGWSVLQPGDAPTLAVLTTYNRTISQMNAGKQEENVEQPDWMSLLVEYPFAYADRFDCCVFDGVKKGYFDEPLLIETAKEAQVQLEGGRRDNSYTRAWDQYWHDLSVDDDKLLGDIFEGAMANLGSINPTEINGTAQLFRESGCDDKADSLIDAYVSARDEEKAFFDLSNHIFMAREIPDPRLVEKFAAKHATFVDSRDPRQVIVDASGEGGWNDDDIVLLASLTAGQLVAVFEGIKGPDLRRSIKFTHMLSRSGSEGAERLKSTLADAMKEIAESSPQRRRRLKSWGVAV